MMTRRVVEVEKECVEIHEDEDEEVLHKPTQLLKKCEAVLDDGEQPTSTAREYAKMDHVDENDCRICSGSEVLNSLFKVINKQTIANKLMKIYMTVAIAPKDFMPRFICNTCLNDVNVAFQWKAQCEDTDSKLRQKLSHSKNKTPADYADDMEIKVSDNGAIKAKYDSNDSDLGTTTKQKRFRRGAGGRRDKR
nr:uncharacterized protein LOC118683053 [Bactrocera oleae]